MDDELIRLRKHVEKLQRENSEKYSEILALNKQNQELMTENMKNKLADSLKSKAKKIENSSDIIFHEEAPIQATSLSVTSRNVAGSLGLFLALKGTEYQLKIDSMTKLFEGNFDYHESPHSLVNINRWEFVIVCPNPELSDSREKITKDEAFKYFHKGFRPEFSKKIKQLRINEMVENKAFFSVFDSLKDANLEEKLFRSKERFITNDSGTFDRCTPPKDYLTLMRNILLVKLGMHLGLHTKQVISSNGKYIYILVCADEEALQNEAESTNYNLQLEIGEIDLSSLEPVDDNLRPLRIVELNNSKIKDMITEISKLIPDSLDIFKISEHEERQYPPKGVTPAIETTYLEYLGYLINGIRKIPKEELSGLSKNVLLQKILQNCIQKANQGKPKEARIHHLWSKLQFDKPLSPYLDYFRKINPLTQECKYKHMWRKYETQNFQIKSIFSSIDRIKLLLSMIKREVNIDYLVEKDILTAFFPLKNNFDINGEKMYNAVLEDAKYEDKIKTYVKDALEKEYKPSEKGINNNWITNECTFRLPLNKIRTYFGEKIAFYFAFISFFSKFISIPSSVGIMVFILQRIYNPESTIIIIINLLFCIYVSIWATVFIEYWKRKENCLAIRWGQTDYKEDEAPRPQFIGEPKRSPIDDDMDDIHFDPTSRYKFYLLSSFVTAIFIAIVIISVLFLIYLRSNITDILIFKGFDLAGPLVSSINALQIQILNVIFGRVAIKLTNLENHRTQTDYENSLILKSYVFQFINSFFSLFYISFFKTNIEGCMVWKGTSKKELVKGDSCVDELYIQFITIFSISFVRNAVELGIPFFKGLKKSQEFKKIKNLELIPTDIVRLRNQIDSQYSLPPYITRDVDGTLGDYLEISILYGYITLFAVAFPLSGFLAFIISFIEIRVDRFKLLYLVRRPIPVGAKDISSWKTIFVFNSVASIVTNSALICFSLPTFKGFPQAEQNKFLIFSIFCLIMLAIRAFIAFAIPDIPWKYDVISKRHRKIAQRFIKGWEVVDAKEGSQRVYVNPEIYCTLKTEENFNW